MGFTSLERVGKHKSLIECFLSDTEDYEKKFTDSILVYIFARPFALLVGEGDIMERYYHLFANGDDAKNFITSESEFKIAFNRVGLCSYLSGATVVAFSIEDSHPHFLLFGEYDVCVRFKNLYKKISTHCIVENRGSLDDVRLVFDLDEINDENYLRNVATYVIIQATKDGKAVMPYDYLFGTGALYFRTKHAMLPWMMSESGRPVEPQPFSTFESREKRKICGSRENVPGDWLVCNGFILPTSYVDIKRYESIFQTHNRFRVFLSSGKDKYTVVLNRMAKVRGIMMEDLEARKVCENLCVELFGRKGTRHITVEQRLVLARELLGRYGLSMRQVSTLSKLPEKELIKYMR